MFSTRRGPAIAWVAASLPTALRLASSRGSMCPRRHMGRDAPKKRLLVATDPRERRRSRLGTENDFPVVRVPASAKEDSARQWEDGASPGRLRPARGVVTESHRWGAGCGSGCGCVGGPGCHPRSVCTRQASGNTRQMRFDARLDRDVASTLRAGRPCGAHTPPEQLREARRSKGFTAGPGVRAPSLLGDTKYKPQSRGHSD